MFESKRESETLNCFILKFFDYKFLITISRIQIFLFKNLTLQLDHKEKIEG